MKHSSNVDLLGTVVREAILFTWYFIHPRTIAKLIYGFSGLHPGVPLDKIIDPWLIMTAVLAVGGRCGEKKLKCIVGVFKAVMAGHLRSLSNSLLCWSQFSFENRLMLLFSHAHFMTMHDIMTPIFLIWGPVTVHSHCMPQTRKMMSKNAGLCWQHYCAKWSRLQQR